MRTDEKQNDSCVGMKLPWAASKVPRGFVCRCCRARKGQNRRVRQLRPLAASVVLCEGVVDCMYSSPQQLLQNSGFVPRPAGIEYLCQVSEMQPLATEVWWRDANLLGEAAQDMLFGPKNRLKRMCAQDLGCVLWAFAMLQWPDEALFQALARAVREQFGTLKPLDIGNVAWALAMSNQMDVSTARMIADHALRQPGDSFGHDFGATAEGWVHVLSSLEEPLSGTVVDLEKWEGLKARFNAAIFAPLCALF